MSVRLAVFMKDQIIRDLAKRAFGKLEDELAAERTALAKKVYADTYPKADLVKMNALPSDFLDTSDYIKAQFGGDMKSLYLGEHRRIAAGRKVRTYPATHAFTDIHRDLDRREKKVAADKKQAKFEARSKLNSVTTVHRLIEVWPEVEPFAQVYLEARKKAAQLPVIQNDALNARFGLPIPAKELAAKKAPVKKARRA